MHFYFIIKIYPNNPRLARIFRKNIKNILPIPQITQIFSKILKKNLILKTNIAKPNLAQIFGKKYCIENYPT